MPTRSRTYAFGARFLTRCRCFRDTLASRSGDPKGCSIVHVFLERSNLETVQGSSVGYPSASIGGVEGRRAWYVAKSTRVDALPYLYPTFLSYLTTYLRQLFRCESRANVTSLRRCKCCKCALKRTQKLHIFQMSASSKHFKTSILCGV